MRELLIGCLLIVTFNFLCYLGGFYVRKGWLAAGKKGRDE